MQSSRGKNGRGTFLEKNCHKYCSDITNKWTCWNENHIEFGILDHVSIFLKNIAGILQKKWACWNEDHCMSLEFFWQNV